MLGRSRYKIKIVSENASHFVYYGFANLIKSAESLVRTFFLMQNNTNGFPFIQLWYILFSCFNLCFYISMCLYTSKSVGDDFVLKYMVIFVSSLSIYSFHFTSFSSSCIVSKHSLKTHYSTMHNSWSSCNVAIFKKKTAPITLGPA